MRLHTFILIICATVMALTAAFFCAEVRTVLSNHVTQLEEANMVAVKQHVATVMRGQLYLLSLYRDGIGQNGALAKAVLLSQGSHQYTDVERELVRAIPKAKLDLAAVLVEGRKTPVMAKGKGTIQFTGGLPVPDRDGFSLARIGDALLLVSYSPVRLYGDEVGTLLLGIDLNRIISGDVQRALGTRISLSAKPEVGTSFPVDLPDGAGLSPIYVVVRGTPATQQGEATLRRVVTIGTGSLLLLGGLIYLAFYFGFLRGFRRNVRGIRRVASELERGVVADFQRERTLFHESRELSGAVSTLSEGLKSFQLQVQEKTRTELLGQVAAQVAHDLNGLITSLELSLELDANRQIPPEKKQGIRHLISRMRGITRTVVDKLRRNTEVSADTPLLSTEETSAEVLSLAVDAVIAEKSLVYATRPYVRIRSSERTAGFVCAKVQPEELRRVLSNLIDNAVDAVGETGDVTVEIAREGDWAEIIVTDSGRGIPGEFLGSLGERGFSHGKKEGSGLGLWHCVTTVNSWGGEVEVSSIPNLGTTVLLRIPSAPLPFWLAEELTIPASGTVYLVDDDAQMILRWKERFSLANADVSVVQLTEAEDLIREVDSGRVDVANAAFIVDYELEGQRWNGLELIEQLKLSSGAILATGHYEDKRVRHECARLGIKLLPKPLIGALAIAVRPGQKRQEGRRK